jgi:hypothetical protein
VSVLPVALEPPVCGWLGVQVMTTVAPFADAVIVKPPLSPVHRPTRDPSISDTTNRPPHARTADVSPFCDAEHPPATETSVTMDAALDAPLLVHE